MLCSPSTIPPAVVLHQCRSTLPRVSCTPCEEWGAASPQGVNDTGVVRPARVHAEVAVRPCCRPHRPPPSVPRPGSPVHRGKILRVRILTPCSRTVTRGGTPCHRPRIPLGAGTRTHVPHAPWRRPQHDRAPAVHGEHP